MWFKHVVKLCGFLERQNTRKNIYIIKLQFSINVINEKLVANLFLQNLWLTFLKNKCE